MPEPVIVELLPFKPETDVPAPPAPTEIVYEAEALKIMEPVKYPPAPPPVPAYPLFPEPPAPPPATWR
jgi:hypothetical protein